jgi:hypothetical protein
MGVEQKPNNVENDRDGDFIAWYNLASAFAMLAGLLRQPSMANYIQATS